jgi:muramidase (phage lysozyme)
MPSGAASPANPPAVDGPVGARQSDAGSSISPAYIQALRDRLQQNPMNAADISAQNRIASVRLPASRDDAINLVQALFRSGEAYGDPKGDGADYNAVNGMGKYKSGQDFSKTSLNDVIAWQIKNGKSDSNGNIQTPAVGAYQFKPGTLRDAARYAGISLDAKFDPATQDALAHAYLSHLGSVASRGGVIDKSALQRKVANIWAALPADDSGNSAYTTKDGKPIRANVDAKRVSDALDDWKVSSAH